MKENELVDTLDIAIGIKEVDLLQSCLYAMSQEVDQDVKDRLDGYLIDARMFLAEGKEDIPMENKLQLAIDLEEAELLFAGLKDLKQKSTFDQETESVMNQMIRLLDDAVSILSIS